MAEQKRGKSKYALKLVVRKRLSGGKSTTSFKGKNSPLPSPLFQDVDESN